MGTILGQEYDVIQKCLRTRENDTTRYCSMTTYMPEFCMGGPDRIIQQFIDEGYTVVHKTVEPFYCYHKDNPVQQIRVGEEETYYLKSSEAEVPGPGPSPEPPTPPSVKKHFYKKQRNTNQTSIIYGGQPAFRWVAVPERDGECDKPVTPDKDLIEFTLSADPLTVDCGGTKKRFNLQITDGGNLNFSPSDIATSTTFHANKNNDIEITLTTNVHQELSQHIGEGMCSEGYTHVIASIANGNTIKTANIGVDPVAMVTFSEKEIISNHFYVSYCFGTTTQPCKR